MSVLRSSALLLVAFVLLPVVAGCGGAAAPGGSASAGTGTGATPPAASQPAGGGGAVVNPPIANGTYTSGKLHVEFTGDVTATLDKPLQGMFNTTDAGTTILNYQDETGDGGGIVLSAAVNGVNVSSKAVSTGGSNVDANVCAVVVTRSDATGLAGTFDCRRILGVVTSGTSPTNVTVDMKGTFEASR